MQSIFFNLAGISITVSIIVILLLLLSSYLDERYVVKWRYFIWLILAIRLIIPFDFGLTAPPLEIHFNDREISYNIDRDQAAGLSSSVLGEAEGEEFEAAGQRAEPADLLPGGKPVDRNDLLTVGRLVIWIYLAGIAVFFLRQFGLYFSFRFATGRWCRRVSRREIQETFDRLKADMGIERTFQIRICRKIVSPMISGLFRPTLLLPREEYQQIDLEVILKHELIHFRRNDLWFKLLLILANALHWFNPLVYVMVREANKDIEISCDEEVLKGAGLPLRKRYSERILELMQGKRHQEAPVSTNFHGGKGMMKSRIRHIFDDRMKKKGVPSFFSVFCLVLAFSACQLNIGQWQIPITVNTADAYGYDSTGNRNPVMSDFEIDMPFDLDRNGSKEAAFSLVVSEKGKTCFLRYQGENGRTIQTRVFDGAEPGVDYSLHAANLEGTDSIMFIISVNYRGMPFDSGYRELYSWNGADFEPVELQSVEENLQMKIMEPEEAEQNLLMADAEEHLFDKEKYPEGDPVLGIYFRDDFTDGERKTLKKIRYLPLSEYDVEGYRTWGQGAVNKTMTGVNFVSGENLEGWRDPDRALLETTEVVFITLPNITATVKRYYQYQDGSWITVGEKVI